MKVLIFYRVNNSKNYDRHYFRYCTEDKLIYREIVENLKDDEYHIYQLADDFVSQNKGVCSLYEMITDFNDDYFKLSEYWCVLGEI